MDAQVSLARILVGDNVAPFTYTDSEIRSVCTLPQASGLPADLTLVGLLTFETFPVGE